MDFFLATSEESFFRDVSNRVKEATSNIIEVGLIHLDTQLE